jgi:adenosine deaminase
LVEVQIRYTFRAMIFSFRWLRALIALASLACVAPAAAQSAGTPEARTAAAMDAIRANPAQLRAFLRTMPKGGDLHNHLAGAVYAEDFLAWAGERGLCVDATALAITPCVEQRAPARGLEDRNPTLYGAMVDSLSMRGWLAGAGPGAQASGHDQFFSTFGRFSAIQSLEHGRSLAAARRMAAADHVSYLELQEAPASMQNGMGAPGDPAFRADDLAGAYSRLGPALKVLAAQAPKDIDAAEAEASAVLGCAKTPNAPGCTVQVRYLCFALRTFTPAQVFRHLAQCFTLAATDKRYVGVNIVAPEDDPVALRDYALHMRMFAFLAAKFPKVRTTLHAGELTLGLVPPEALRHNIAQAIAVGAKRIGHGVDIAFEADSAATLARMARERIAVEINLVSNDVILGVRGGDHPLALYRAAGAPFVLATDDEGVLRTDMTEQYVRAVVDQGLSYGDLKTAARNALEYSFIEDSAKATLKAKLEKDFAAFEATH